MGEGWRWARPLVFAFAEEIEQGLASVIEMGIQKGNRGHKNEE
jgi:hypothetical protein